MFPEIGGVLLALLEVGIAAPVEMPCQHVGAVAHAEQQRAFQAVGIFVQFARRMHHERARLHLHAALGRVHRAAAAVAEIDLGRVRMAVIGTDLPGLPAGDRHVALAHLAEDLFHVLPGVELLLRFKAEHVHMLVSRQAPRQQRRAPPDGANPSPTAAADDRRAAAGTEGPSGGYRRTRPMLKYAIVFSSARWW